MTTPLGPGSGNQVTHGLNVDSVTIPKGQAAALGSSAQFIANKYLPDSIVEDALPVVLVSGAADVVIGVATRDVPAGEVGEFLVKGLGVVLSFAAIAADAVLQITTNGKFDDTGGINTAAAYGKNLSADPGGADVLFTAYINIPSMEAEA